MLGYVLWWIILCHTLKGVVEAQEPTESLSDVGLDDSTLDFILSSGKDIHSVTRCCYKGEKWGTYVFVGQILVPCMWDTPGLYADMLIN